MIHEMADVQSTEVGAGCRLWQFVVVLPGARIGADCTINPHSFVDNDVVLGNRVTIAGGVRIPEGMRVGDDVAIGANASFAPEDRTPGSESTAGSDKITIHDGASIGAGAIVLPGVDIGRRAFVAAGAVVNRTVPPNAIVEGNPSKIVGYVNTRRSQATEAATGNEDPGFLATGVNGVTLHRMPRVVDMRGNLTVGEFEKSIPFSVRRYFMVFDVPSMETRGEHAHKQCHQFLICVAGRCALLADDGVNRQEFLLDQPDIGIHLPPMVWGVQYKYSPDAVLLVFASDYYDSDDYIRNYSQFLEMIKSK